MRKRIRRVVITGMGTVNPLGNSTADAWQAARQGGCGIGEITRYDTAAQKVKIAAEIKNLDIEGRLDRREAKKMDRYTQLALIAAEEAFIDSGLDMAKEEAGRIGVMVASGIGGLGTIETEHHKGEEKGFDRVSPFFIPMAIANMAAGHIAIRFGLKGMCAAVVTACASGSNAIGDSFRQIRDGYADAMVCGGAEASITPLGMGGFTSMKALSTSSDPARASIPFDLERSGFVMGEGAGILVLEELERARARGARIYGEIVGYGANCDAYHITAPAAGGAGAAECMRLALEDAGLVGREVGYINAHGTSTPMNDACETAAIKACFGPHAARLAVSSTKSMTGHLLGASGGVEAIFTVLALRDAYLPPTIGYRTPDPECDLDVVPNVGRPADIRYAMSNSLGFGGHNASLLLKRWEEE